jgi:hypothetical protein
MYHGSADSHGNLANRAPEEGTTSSSPHIRSTSCRGERRGVRVSAGTDETLASDTYRLWLMSGASFEEYKEGTFRFGHPKEINLMKQHQAMIEVGREYIGGRKWAVQVL